MNYLIQSPAISIVRSSIIVTSQLACTFLIVIEKHTASEFVIIKSVSKLFFRGKRFLNVIQYII